jgi:ABC-type uncharacterized transport system auxiliary subunit
MRTLAIAVVLAIIAGAGCRSQAPRHYYTLTSTAPTVRFARPFPVKLRVAEMEMRRTYRRDELVTRADVNELTFLRRQRWSEPPQRMISGITREHLRQSRIGVEIQDESTIDEPDFVLGGEIEAIEQLTAGDEHYARLAMTFRLRSFKDDRMVWDFRIDARRAAARSPDRRGRQPARCAPAGSHPTTPPRSTTSRSSCATTPRCRSASAPSSLPAWPTATASRWSACTGMAGW